MVAPKPTSGFTLVEALVGIVVMTVVMSGLYSLVGASSKASHATVSLTMLDEKASRLLAQISKELIQSSRATISPDPMPPLGSASLEYARAIGVWDGKVQWGRRRSIELRPAAGDPQDGLDNDGDGLVDECEVILRMDAGSASERSVVLADGITTYLDGESPNGIDDNGNGLIDEPGLCFESRGNRIIIRVTVAGLGPDRFRLVRRLETSISFRN